jgi:hypothetical protein
MKTFGHLLWVLSLLFFSGCSALLPKATPQDAQTVLQKATLYSPERRALGASKASRLPLRRGQWVATLMRSKKDPNDVTLQIMKVADVSGGAAVVEMEQYASTNGGKRMVVQQKIRNFPAAGALVYREGEIGDALKNIEIESVKMMGDDGTVQEVPQLGLPVGRIGADLLKGNVATGEVRTEACKTEMVKAASCYVVPYASKALWMVDRGISFAHSDIPITGQIRADSESTDSQVIGFGNTGAKVLIR